MPLHNPGTVPRALSRSELLDRITAKLRRVENTEALQLLDELLDKKGIADKLVRSRAFLKML